MDACLATSGGHLKRQDRVCAQATTFPKRVCQGRGVFAVCVVRWEEIKMCIVHLEAALQSDNTSLGQAGPSFTWVKSAYF